LNLSLSMYVPLILPPIVAVLMATEPDIFIASVSRNMLAVPLYSDNDTGLLASNITDLVNEP
jgi:hypothetical protein